MPAVPGIRTVLSATAALLALALPAAAETPRQVMRSPADCVNTLKLDPAVCAAVMQRAWALYQDNAPRYPTRRSCWRNHQVCVPIQTHWLLVDERRGPFRPFLDFGPPLVAIAIRPDAPDEDPEVLVDRGLAAIPKGMLTPVRSVGRFSPTAERIRDLYMRAYEEPRAPETRGRAGPARPGREPPQRPGGFSPQDTFPVSPERLRAIRRAMQR